MSEAKVELLPCPFCGGAVSFHGAPDDDDCSGCHNIYCKSCDALFDMALHSNSWPTPTETLDQLRAAIAPKWNTRALRHLEAAEQGEAVAWRMNYPSGPEYSDKKPGLLNVSVTPLYAHPPAPVTSGDASERAMLTDSEIIEIAKNTKSAEPGREGYILPVTFARAILAALSNAGEGR